MKSSRNNFFSLKRLDLLSDPASIKPRHYHQTYCGSLMTIILMATVGYMVYLKLPEWALEPDDENV